MKPEGSQRIAVRFNLFLAALFCSALVLLHSMALRPVRPGCADCWIAGYISRRMESVAERGTLTYILPTLCGLACLIGLALPSRAPTPNSN